MPGQTQIPVKYILSTELACLEKKPLNTSIPNQQNEGKKLLDAQIKDKNINSTGQFKTILYNFALESLIRI